MDFRTACRDAKHALRAIGAEDAANALGLAVGTDELLEAAGVAVKVLRRAVPIADPMLNDAVVGAAERLAAAIHFELGDTGPIDL